MSCIYRLYMSIEDHLAGKLEDHLKACSPIDLKKTVIAAGEVRISADFPTISKAREAQESASRSFPQIDEWGLVAWADGEAQWLDSDPLPEDEEGVAYWEEDMGFD